MQQRECLLRILLQFRGGLHSLDGSGFRVSSVTGDVAAGFISAGRLEELTRHENVVAVELSHALHNHMDMSAVAISLVDSSTDLRTIPAMGEGAIIGVVDSGFDLTHPCFYDGKGRTRIIAAWDQTNLKGIKGERPLGFGYGIEYKREMLDVSIRNHDDPIIIANQEEGGGHGTQVASVAAASGELKGVAPRAELVLVAFRNDSSIGGSASIVDAIRYVIDQARRLGRPVVINLSQGDHFGAHDGSSLLEKAIDNFVHEGRVLIIVSAGNERHGPANHHATGVVQAGQEFSLPFTIESKKLPQGDQIQLWYKPSEKFDIAIRTPSGSVSPTIRPGTFSVIKFPEGSEVQISSELNTPINGHNLISITFAPGDFWDHSGNWNIVLSAQSVNDGEFHAWVDRPGTFTLISFVEHQSEYGTVTLPGTAREAITVGSFVSRRLVGTSDEHAKGTIELGSSFGPTRDGRMKPDLVAPGAVIFTPGTRPFVCDYCYGLRRGTSYAAPQVTGVIALMWGLWPGLTAEKMRTALLCTAQLDEFTGHEPNSTCGHGKLNALAVYEFLLKSLQTTTA